MNNPLNYYYNCDDDSEVGEHDSFVPNTQKNDANVSENQSKNGSDLVIEGEIKGVEVDGEDGGVELDDEGLHVDSNLREEEFTYESPLYLYGPDWYSRRMRRRKGRHVRPPASCSGSVMTRNDELPEYFQDVEDLVVPDSIDGYEGVDLRDLEDDAESIRGEDPFARKNMVVDLFTPPRNM